MQNETEVEISRHVTFSEKYGSKIFSVFGVLFAILLGSTISLVMEETFRSSYLENFGLSIRLIRLTPFPYLIQFISGLIMFICLYLMFRYIKNKNAYEPFIKTFTSCLLILIIHIGLITGISYFGASGFTGIAEEGFLSISATRKISIVPWENVEKVNLSMTTSGLNREMFKYVFLLKDGNTKEILARPSDKESVIASSWVLSRANLRLETSPDATKLYDSTLSVLGE